MKKLTKNEEIEKIKNNLSKKIKSENDFRYNSLSSNEIMKIVIDSSCGGKYVFWVCREYLKDNIQRFEDMGRVKQTLILFKNNLHKFDNSQKQLNKLSFQELENLVEPYQDVLTQNAIKRVNKEKIWSEIDVIYNGPEGRIYVPKTREAAMFLGQGTKWCTASINDNMFEYYNDKGLLYIFILPEKDTYGREIKYQLHFETNQFMNSEDKKISIEEKSKINDLLEKFFTKLDNHKKISEFIRTDFVSDLFSEQKEIESIKKDLFIEKTKINKKIYISEYQDNVNFFCKIFDRFPAELFEKIPVELINEELCLAAVKAKHDFLHFIPEKFKTYDLCKTAVKKHGNALRYVPHAFRTEEMIELALKNDGNALCYVEYSALTPELCEIAVSQKNSCAFIYIPDKMKTQELCKIAVKHNADSFKHIPPVLKTKEIIEWSLKNNGLVLENIQHEQKTYNLCEIAVLQNAGAIKYVPYNLRKKLCYLAIKNNIFPQYISNIRVPHEMQKEFVNKNGLLLEYIPEKDITNDLCEIAVSQNGFSVCYVPQHLITKKICEIAIEENPFSFVFFPEKFKTEHFFNSLVKRISHLNNLCVESNEFLKMLFNNTFDEISSLKSSAKENKTLTTRHIELLIFFSKKYYIKFVASEYSKKLDQEQNFRNKLSF